MANSKMKGAPPKRHQERSQPAVPPSSARYSAAGAPPLTLDSHIVLQEPFTLKHSLAEGLRRREINEKEAFTIRDRSGAFFRASLKELHHDSGVALPYEKMDRSPEASIDITLACAVLARQRMIFVMQKATELGVARIVPLITDHSVQQEGLEHEKAFSWPAQILRAARQCRRASLPDLSPPLSLGSFTESNAFTSAEVRVVLDDRSEPTQATDRSIRSLILLVGPEGGFSEDERAMLRPHTRAWALGGRILRAETAVIVGLTAVHTLWGDFDPR